jgi:hypothetical protein
MHSMNGPHAAAASGVVALDWQTRKPIDGLIGSVPAYGRIVTVAVSQRPLGSHTS